MTASTEVSAQSCLRPLRAPNSKQLRLQMMIVDDCYCIIGSANINQRSMAGSKSSKRPGTVSTILGRNFTLARDTEIAVGCWQPSFPECNPFGEVHTFRMGLWAALFCVSDPAFRFDLLHLCIQSLDEKAKIEQVSGDNRMRDKGEGVCLPQLADVQRTEGIEHAWEPLSLSH